MLLNVATRLLPFLYILGLLYVYLFYHVLSGRSSLENGDVRSMISSRPSIPTDRRSGAKGMEPFRFSHGQVRNKTCPKFIMHHFETDAGIGHLVSELATTLASALILGDDVTFVYEPATNWVNLSSHGSMAWGEEFLRLDYGESTWDMIQREYNPRIVSMGGNFCGEVLLHECNVLCQRSHYLLNGSKRLSLYNVSMAYEKIKHIMRIKFRTATFQPATFLFEDDFYNVAWHIRVGDISPYWGYYDYFKKLIELLDTLLEGFQKRIYVFAESPSSGQGSPPGFEFLTDLLPNGVFVNDMDSPSTLYHFANADMVVNFGSSFSLMTELISPKPILVASPAKEDSRLDFYNTHETLSLHETGGLAGRSISEAQALVVDRYESYHFQRIPFRGGGTR